MRGHRGTQYRSRRAFWRILFDVVPDGNSNFTISLRKEWSVWEERVRIANGVVDLTWSLKGRVRIYDGKVQFTNGYVECFDQEVPDFEALLRNPQEKSTANQGENVSLSIEACLTETSAQFPLFCYPQDTRRPEDAHNYLMLSVLSAQRNPNARDINWKIEREGCQAVGLYEISGRDCWHRVRVRQDQDWKRSILRRLPGLRGLPSLARLVRANYFEFLVDSIPLDRQSIRGNGSFTFTNEDKVFYIGRVPDPDHNCTLGSTQPDNHWINLTGELRHLVFDPNDSCSSCGG